MNIRYFYGTEKIAARDVKIEYCPTEQMVADYFTKPLQGSLFKRLRDVIVNIDSSSVYHSSHKSVLEEINDQDGTGSLGNVTASEDGLTDVQTDVMKANE
jgi:hypothetical protein